MTTRLRRSGRCRSGRSCGFWGRISTLTFRTRGSANRAFWSYRTGNAFSGIANEMVRWPRRGFRTIRSLQSPRRSQRTDRMSLQRLADGDDSVWHRRDFRRAPSLRRIARRCRILDTAEKLFAVQLCHQSFRKLSEQKHQQKHFDCYFLRHTLRQPLA